MTNFIKIFGGILLSGIGVVIIGSTNNFLEKIVGIIFIALGISSLLKD